MLINHTIKSSSISFLAEYRKWKGSEGHFMGIKISDLLGPPVGLFWPGHTHSHYEHFTLCQLKYCHKFTRLCLLVFLGLTATFWWLMKIRESILIPPLREKIITQSQKCCHWIVYNQWNTGRKVKTVATCYQEYYYTQFSKIIPSLSVDICIVPACSWVKMHLLKVKLHFYQLAWLLWQW